MRQPSSRPLDIPRRRILGGQTQTESPGTVPGLPPPPGSNGSGLQSWLTDILNEMIKEWDAGQVRPFIDYQTVTTATVVQRLYASHNPVRRAVIQNLSSTDTLTLFAAGSSGGQGGASGSGIVLNAASAGGQGGGSIAVDNVDLYYFWITCSTNNAQAFSVYGET